MNLLNSPDVRTLHPIPFACGSTQLNTNPAGSAAASALSPAYKDCFNCQCKLYIQPNQSTLFTHIPHVITASVVPDINMQMNGLKVCQTENLATPGRVQQLESALVTKVRDVTVHLKHHETSPNERYKLDAFFGQEDNNISLVFGKEVSPFIPQILEDYNLTIFHYAARGSGKTYTMQGSENLAALMPLAMYIHLKGLAQVALLTYCNSNVAELGNKDNRRTCNTGIRLQERTKIDQSLFALSNVIYALNNNQPRIPYTENKLTRLLQDTVGGTRQYQESLHTVSLAARSRQISNFLASAQKANTPKVKTDMEAKLQPSLQSKGNTKGTHTIGPFDSPFTSKTPNSICSTRKVQDLGDTGGQREEKKIEVVAERVVPHSNTAVHGTSPNCCNNQFVHTPSISSQLIGNVDDQVLHLMSHFQTQTSAAAEIENKLLMDKRSFLHFPTA
ncbi:hypothetical protein KY284_032120 [Solanum tuberosum]|nr:hypothetical protein KY284_032120 [Solanum tuberosum]